MDNSYLLLVNPALNRTHQTPGVTIQFLPGQPVTIGYQLLSLAFFIPTQLGDQPFPVDQPNDFVIEAELTNPFTSKQITLRSGDFIELKDDFLIWPVAFDIDNHSHAVRKVLARIIPIDPQQPVDHLQLIQY